MAKTTQAKKSPKGDEKEKGMANYRLDDSWVCNCTNSVIQKVDTMHPHPVIRRDGWFCMGCLNEFEPKKQ
jgi:hypothetical protein